MHSLLSSLLSPDGFSTGKSGSNQFSFHRVQGELQGRMPEAASCRLGTIIWTLNLVRDPSQSHPSLGVFPLILVRECI